MFYVYCIQNVTNKKIYIGRTFDCKKRWCAEIYTAFNKNSGGYRNALSGAFRKYAKTKDKVKDFFTFQVLEEFENLEESLEAEQFWIEFFRSNVYQFGRSFGYNLTSGGEGVLGLIHSEESKKKQAISMMGKFAAEKNPFFGKKHTEESKIKLSESLKRAWEISKANGGRISPLLGKPMSEEQKEKISKAQAGKYIGENNNCAKLTWEIVNKIRHEYKGGENTQEELGIKYNISTVSLIINNKRWIDNTYTPPSRYYRKQSQETKDKIKLAHVGMFDGDKSLSAKLTWEQVNKIREKYIPGKITYKMLADEYNVKLVTISAIIKYKTWKIK